MSNVHEATASMRKVFEALRANPDSDNQPACVMAETMAEAMDHLANTECGEEVIAHFIRQLDYRTIGALMLQMPVAPGGVDMAPNKHLAVDVAETIGPDRAQAWYRFIVLVTKVT